MLYVPFVLIRFFHRGNISLFFRLFVFVVRKFFEKRMTNRKRSYTVKIIESFVVCLQEFCFHYGRFLHFTTDNRKSLLFTVLGFWSVKIFILICCRYSFDKIFKVHSWCTFFDIYFFCCKRNFQSVRNIL